jgi:hypothetical protein
MKKVLSQEEIDSLIRAARAGGERPLQYEPPAVTLWDGRRGSLRISGRVDRKHHSDADSDRRSLAHVGNHARAARLGSASPRTRLASDGGGRRIATRRNESGWCHELPFSP